MLETILFLFFVVISPLLLLIKLTKFEPLKYIYFAIYHLKFSSFLLLLYGFNLSISYVRFKLRTLMLKVPMFFGYKHFNKEIVEFANLNIPGTDYNLSYISTELPFELVYKWRKDKVYYNYIRSILRANHDYVNVPLAKFQPPLVISDIELESFVFSSQITHYLTKKEGMLIFDMSPFVQELRLPNTSFEVKQFIISADRNLDSMQIIMFDGTIVKAGEKHWALAKVYFMSNTMVFFILGAHLHHHLFFAEMGSALLFNNIPKDSAFYKLMTPHTDYILMLNHQFKTNPLSLRETTGFIDKFLYTCIGYYSPSTFYKVGYENALNMYGKRKTTDDALTKVSDIKFAIPFDRYLNGDYPLNEQLRGYYSTVKEFVAEIYDTMIDLGDKPVMQKWIFDLCNYVNLETKMNDKAFNIEVISTYIWYVSFVHSLEHYSFDKYKRNYCLLIRKPFAEAKNMPLSEVFSQYDIWKSKHIVLTFGRNHQNKNISEGYTDLDYGFTKKKLQNQQENFKENVSKLLAEFNIPADAIALSIRY